MYKDECTGCCQMRTLLTLMDVRWSVNGLFIDLKIEYSVVHR